MEIINSFPVFVQDINTVRISVGNVLNWEKAFIEDIFNCQGSKQICTCILNCKYK